MASRKISITELAYSDLEEIEKFIGNNSAKLARNFINKIFNHIELLANHPELGRIVPEFNQPELREIIQGKYRIVYRITEEIQILRIIHGSRLLDLK
jgi:addiction module RelE/StbE family toxin